MNKRIICILLIIIFLLITTGCQNENQRNNKITNTDNDNIINNVIEEINSVKILINNKEYVIDFENNETTKEFVSKLPIEFNMKELNGNEKYAYLDEPLPTSSVNPKHINAGDVMLFGDNCLVIFYKSFDTSYSYTRIGHINNLPNLGKESIKVKIER